MLKQLGLVVCCSAALLAGGVWADAKNVDLVQQVQQFSQEDKVAIVVGVKDYDQARSGFRPLDYADRDAQLLSGVLQGRGYQNPRRLLNHQATKSFILSAIQQSGKRFQQGEGTLVFAFSGHGTRIGEENYLATIDATAHNIQQTGLSVSELVQAIKRTGVKRAVLFLDACRDNPTPGIKGGQSGFADQDYGEGIQILFATAKGEVSWEHKDLEGGRGVFSYFLEQGFRKGGVVTFNSLAGDVEQQVVKWTDGRVSQTQRPFRSMVGESRGDFVLARSGASMPEEPAPVPPPPAPVVTRSQPAPRPQPVPIVPLPQPATATRQSFEPEMVSIPAGSFTMGCKPGRDDGLEGGCYDYEKPAHTVQVSAFLIGKYEVTFDEWDACEQAKACPHAEDGGWGRGRRPVINVSWDDAQTYLQWLSRETGKQYRLPTGAEWEYAARGGRESAFPWGDQIGCGNARYGGVMDGNPCKSTSTVGVGSYAANGFGLHDTAGNVWEWVNDWFGGYAAAAASDPQGPGSGSYRVLRGGSWNNDPQNLRAANRDSAAPGYRSINVGFRPAQVYGQ